MKNMQNFLWALAALLLANAKLGECQKTTEPIQLKPEVFNIRFDPASPASLNLGDKIQVSFEYVVSEKGGARIFARPMTRGALSPNYAASGSPVYPAGRGNGSASFRIESGGVTIDQVRFQMYNHNQTVLFFETFLPVQYTYADDTPGVIPLPENLTPFENSSKPKILPDGGIEIIKPSGEKIGISQDGTKTIYDPTSGTTRTDSRIEVPPVTPPVSSHGLTENWRIQMEAWIEYIGIVLLAKIEALVNDRQSFDNYLAAENRNCNSVYERVDFRVTYVTRLTTDR